MTRRKSFTTIQDVAVAAGVSVSTVSRVLNDKDDVAPETYETVQRIISELGYTSSLAAKSMRSRQTNVIGLVVPDVNDSFSIQVMRGVNQAVAQFGYDLLMFTGGNGTAATRTIREQQYVSRLNGGIADGVIIVASTALTFPSVHPIVAVDHHPKNTDFPSVIATNQIGALAAMEYLISLGHRRIGFIGGRADLQSSVRRYKGYVDGLQQVGIPVDPDLVEEGNFTMDSGYRCGKKLLALPERPTAIFAANDQTAFGAIKAAHEMGIYVPDNLSVTGFDNIPEAIYYLPAGLTTIDQGLQQMGQVATEMLMSLINGEKITEPVRKIPTQLIIRGSCKPI